MFRVSNQDHGKAYLQLEPYRVCLTILSMFILFIASCAPQVPVPVANTPNSQPQSATMIASATLGVGSTQVSLKDGMVMVFVPAGEFKMGGASDDGSSWPVHTVYLDAFWIDQTEVTNEMFARFVESTGYVTDAEQAGVSNDFFTGVQGVYWDEVKGLTWNQPDGENSNISGLEEHPVVHVSWNDANAYCTWAERRLPTEAEWEKAASWNDVTEENYDYPWGNDFDETRVNSCDKNCAYDFANRSFDDGHAGTSPVGSFPEGASPYGALDMSGNVLEWVADWYDVNYYKNSPGSNPSGPDSGQERVSRGGAWATSDYFVGTARRWAQGGPSFQHRALGFRCAQNASP